MSESQKHIILIWQEVGEDRLAIYAFPETHPDVKKLLSCNGKYINGEKYSREDFIHELNDKLCNEDCKEGEYEKFCVKNIVNTVDWHIPSGMLVTRFVVCGFIL